MEAVKRVENNPNSWFRYKATSKFKNGCLVLNKVDCTFEEALENARKQQELIKLVGR